MEEEKSGNTKHHNDGDKSDKSKSKKSGDKSKSKKSKHQREYEVPVSNAEISEWSFFEALIGVDEETFRKDPTKYLTVKSDTPDPISASLCTKKRFPGEGVHFILHKDGASSSGSGGSGSSGEEYDAGRLYFPSLGELSSAHKKATGQTVRKTWLHLQTNTKGESMKDVDVAQLQANTDNCGALFQVASNLNTVEASNENNTPDSDDFVTQYLNDKTQGPIASISAAPAAVTRVYTPFYEADLAAEEWAQTRDRQISMLYELPEYYTVSNGYIINYGGEEAFDERSLDAVVRKIHVGLHKDVQVVFGEREKGHMSVVTKPNQRVSQLTCAGMNLMQGQSGTDNKKLEGSALKAQALLRAAYQASYYAAIAMGCKKLFLTLVGGGVFGNPLPGIFSEIVKAHKEIGMSKYNCSLENVYLIFYSMPPAKEFNAFVDDLKKNGVPFDSNEALIEKNEGEENKKGLSICTVS